ncbi:MAG: hypothetical protein F6K56_31855 [Moorea sp. SIO3G5]|nr:hypothetical protein [Moorena sp. SIO3G5]
MNSINDWVYAIKRLKKNVPNSEEIESTEKTPEPPSEESPKPPSKSMASRLKELKQKFTELTGVPANKRSALLVCEEGSLEGRRMMSIVDWEHAISHIKKRLVDVDEPTPVASQPEPEQAATEESEIRVASTYELICTQPEYIAEAIAEAEIKVGNYMKLIKVFHPDSSKLPKDKAESVSKILNNVRDKLEQQGYDLLSGQPLSKEEQIEDIFRDNPSDYGDSGEF